MPTLWMVNTRSCNFDCVYCFQGCHKWTWQKDKGLTKNMTMDVIDAMIQWAPQWVLNATDSGNSRSPSVRFPWYGGEPLVNFHVLKHGVVKIDQTFKSKGISMSQGITTNGSLITPSIMQFLDMYNVNMLFSLDGPPWIHNKQRVYYGNKPTWDDIDIELILKHRPDVEIAWQLDPRTKVTMDDVEWMIGRKFHRINFNINCMHEWSGDSQLWLTELMKNVGRACIQTEKKVRPQEESLASNMWHKFKQGVGLWASGKDRGEKPCGTSTNMLALSPEGWLYPSQEMVFNSAEPSRAPGTMEYYKVGSVFQSPVLDPVAVDRANDIYVSQMIEPEGFNCQNCVARKLSFGGCHCRYVGQDGVDPAHRHTVMPGWCQHSQAYWNGLMQAAMIEGLFTMKELVKNNDGEKRYRRQPGTGIHGPICQPV